MTEPMTCGNTMLDLLARWVACGWLREVDLALARFLVDEVPDAPPPLLLAAALASHQLGRGHVCLDLTNTVNNSVAALSLPPDSGGQPEPDTPPQPAEVLAGWSAARWRAALAHPALVDDGSGVAPLVLAGPRLYLRRYWHYERQVEHQIGARLHRRTGAADDLLGTAIRHRLDDLFPPAPAGGINWQKVACALAARSAFSIITGGPGTGKTTTVVRLLVLLQAIALGRNPQRPLVIRLAAPTGKAAARLKESILGAIARLPAFVSEDAALSASITAEVTTLHRLLGSRPQSRQFRHHAGNPLPLDVLVIDEGSMVDLEMMAAVLAALPERAALVLLGDKDQLASVEAGSVLGELCRRAGAGHYLPATADWVSRATGEQIGAGLLDDQGTPLDQHVVMLRESHRFTGQSGIGLLAAAVNAGDSATALALLKEPRSDLAHHTLKSLDGEAFALTVMGSGTSADRRPGCADYLRVVADERPSLNADKGAFDTWAARVLAAHGHFQLLCALRNGPYGVAGLNERIETLLAAAGLIQPQGQWYSGRPVMVSRNDYQLGLMNGDIGISLPYPVGGAEGRPSWGIRVAFPQRDAPGGIRWVLPSRLTAVETVFALTVHKSQGSEFSHCALLLPPRANPVLTRELLYTGITRAKERFTLLGVGESGTLEGTIAATVQRSGGLFIDG